MIYSYNVSYANPKYFFFLKITVTFLLRRNITKGFYSPLGFGQQPRTPFFISQTSIELHSMVSWLTFPEERQVKLSWQDSVMTVSLICKRVLTCHHDHCLVFGAFIIFLFYFIFSTFNKVIMPYLCLNNRSLWNTIRDCMELQWATV